MKAKNLLLLLITLSLIITGCGGGGSKGGGGGDSSTGSASGSVYFDASPTAVSTSVNSSLSGKLFTKGLKQYGRIGQKAVPNQKIVKFRSGISQAEIENIIARLGGKIKKKIYGSDNLYIVTVSSSNSLSKKAIKDNKDIIYSEENLYCHALAVPNDTYYANQTWNLSMLRMPQAWDITKGNDKIVVAVVDTGVSLTHPDLQVNLVAGYDFVNNDDNPSDDEGHGTHVAGIISAVTNNNQGVAGVAWNVKIMPVKVLDSSGGGYLSDAIEGINWAASHGAHIINLSLGAECTSSEAPQSFKDAIDNVISRGITVVAAAGNIGETSYTGVNFPANYPPVIAVAALGSDGTRASYSCYGPEIDISAPGGSSQGVYSTYLPNSYDNLIGTSMAAPHVSGLVALLYSRGVANPYAAMERLQNYSTDLGTTGKDNYYGYGIPRADEVLSGALPDLRSVKVFVGDLSGNMLSEPRNPTISGFYSLTNIPVGSRTICAFLDRDMNGQVNNGDKFAYISVNIIGNQTVTNANIELIQQVSGLATPLSIADYYKNLMQNKK